MGRNDFVKSQGRKSDAFREAADRVSISRKTSDDFGLVLPKVLSVKMIRLRVCDIKIEPDVLN